MKTCDVWILEKIIYVNMHHLKKPHGSPAEPHLLSLDSSSAYVWHEPTFGMTQLKSSDDTRVNTAACERLMRLGLASLRQKYTIPHPIYINRVCTYTFCRVMRTSKSVK